MAAFWRGVESGACALAVSALFRWLFQAPFLPELTAQRLFGLVPMKLFELFVRTLGSWAKWVAFVAVVLLILAAAGALGRVLDPIAGKGPALLHVAWTTAALTAFGAAAVLPLLGFSPAGTDLFPPPRIPAAIGILVPSAAYAAWFFRGAAGLRRLWGGTRGGRLGREEQRRAS